MFLSFDNLLTIQEMMCNEQKNNLLLNRASELSKHAPRMAGKAPLILKIPVIPISFCGTLSTEVHAAFHI
jgi:hypothetical protein